MSNSDQREESKKQKNSSSSRSSEESVDPCPICLSPVVRESFLNKCSHKFCFDCIVKWAKVVSRKKSRKLASLKCPLCKTKNFSVERALNEDPFQPSSFTIRLVLTMKRRDGRYQHVIETESPVGRELMNLSTQQQQFKQGLRAFFAHERKCWEYFKAWDKALFEFLQKKTTNPIPEVPVFPDHILVSPVHEDAESSTSSSIDLATLAMQEKELDKGLRAFQAQHRKYWEYVKARDQALFRSLQIILVTEPVAEFPIFPDHILAPPIPEQVLATPIPDHIFVPPIPERFLVPSAHEETELATSVARGLTMIVAQKIQAQKEEIAFHAQLGKYWEYVYARDKALVRSFQKMGPPKFELPIFGEQILVPPVQGEAEQEANEAEEEPEPMVEALPRRLMQVCGGQLGPATRSTDPPESNDAEQ